MPGSISSTSRAESRGPITEAGCWAHARRKLFELADIAAKARKPKLTTISELGGWKEVNKKYFDKSTGIVTEIAGNAG